MKPEVNWRDSNSREETSIDTVRKFWEETPCGEHFVSDMEEGEARYFRAIARERYRYEYHLMPFLERVVQTAGHDRVLEIGCGMGIDASELVKRNVNLTGIDLTERGIELAKRNFKRLNLEADLRTGDAENLEFPENYFGAVYSFGVLHHTPETGKAVGEILRVLRPGGKAFIMLYARYSFNNMVHKLFHIPYEKTKSRAFRDAPITKTCSRKDLVRVFAGFVNCRFEKRYLFGAGYRPLIHFVPQVFNDWLGRIVGWHWLIEAEKPE